MSGGAKQPWKVIAIAVVLPGPAAFLLALAGLAAIIGLYIYEYVFVMAPQDIPNS